MSPQGPMAAVRRGSSIALIKGDAEGMAATFAETGSILDGMTTCLASGALLCQPR